MPFDGAKLSQTAILLQRLQTSLRESGRDGWCRGSWYKPGPTQHQFCLLGRLMFVADCNHYSSVDLSKPDLVAVIRRLANTADSYFKKNNTTYATHVFSDAYCAQEKVFLLNDVCGYTAACELVDRALEEEVKECLSMVQS